VPMINPRTGIFVGGMRINYGPFIARRHKDSFVDDLDYPFESESEKNDRLPSYTPDKYDEPRQPRRSPPRSSQAHYIRMYISFYILTRE
jgi:hypothetical protein